jgi:hypothetical protein
MRGETDRIREGPEASGFLGGASNCDGESEVGFLDGASAQTATGCKKYQVHVVLER